MSATLRRLASLLVAALLVSGCGSGFAEPQLPGHLIPAEQRLDAPAFDGTRLAGGDYDSSVLRGSIAVVNFWAQWCGPCRVESPALQDLYDARADDGVQVVGVNIKDDKQLATAFVADYGLTYPILFDPRSEVALAFGNLPLGQPPASIVVDRAGRVAAVYTTELTAEDLNQTIDQLLAEPA